MGMFDDITCDYPFPGGTPSFGNRFQTKSLGCELRHYRIAEDGKLLDDGGNVVTFTGELNFYNDNSTGGWGEVRYTADGEDYESAGFTATFHDDVLVKIVDDGRESAAGIVRLPRQGPTADELARHSKRTKESFVGKRMFLLYGGREVDEGYWVDVVHENENALIVEYDDRGHKHTEVCERRLFIDHLLWETKEAAAADHQARLDAYESEVRRYREAVATREQRLAKEPT